MTLEQINVQPIDRWLVAVCAANATDLMLTPNSPPRIRVDGRLHVVPGEKAIDADTCTATILSILPPSLQAELIAEKELDFSFTYQTTHRFRGNAFFQQNTIALALRAIPLDIPTPEELGLPNALAGICEFPQGFVLVTGPTGSGKSTTLASLIDYINQRARGAHPHDRGSDRIRAHAQEVGGEPA